MTNGDAAAAAGLAVVSGATGDVRDGYDEINKTRDYIANHMTAGTHGASAINSGTLDAARLPSTVPLKDGSGNLIIPGYFRSNGSLTSLSDVNVAGGGIFASRPGVAGWTSAVLRNSDGQLGVATSSRRFKQDIAPADPRRTLLAVEVVRYRYISEVEEHGDGAAFEIGVIAEQLHDLGLHEYVVYRDEEGDDVGLVPFSVRYELMVCDLLLIVQDHDERLVALELKASK